MNIFEAIIIAVISTLVGIITGISIRKGKKKTINNVHFYVARDKRDYKLWLYMGKPVRSKQTFKGSSCSAVIIGEYQFSDYGLDVNDYANLKFEDEPVEVFLNLED